MNKQKELMQKLADLEFEAEMYTHAAEGCAETEEEFRGYEETSTRLFDRFYHHLAINAISLEEYRDWWKSNRAPIKAFKASRPDTVPF